MKQRANLRSPLFLQYASRPAEAESENQVTYSEDFTQTSYWNNKVDVTVTKDVIEAPDGTLTANKIQANSGTNFKILRKGAFTIPSGTTMSMFVKRATHPYILFKAQGDYGFNLDTLEWDGSYSNVGYEVYGNGWVRLYVTTTSSASSYFGVYLVDNGFSQYWTATGNESVYVWGAQYEQQQQVTSYIKTEGTTVTRAATTAAQEEDVTAELRIYNGGGGYDYERTNGVHYSEDFTQSNWFNSDSTDSISTVVSPDGASLSTLLTSTASNGGLADFNEWSTAVKTASIYVKKNTSSTFKISNLSSPTNEIVFNLDSGTIQSVGGNFSGQIISLSNGWFRCVGTHQAASSQTLGFVISTSGQSVYIWGAQVEEGAQATSYIKTEATAVTELAYQTEAPAEATYILTRTPNNAKATFEVSELVRDYIEQTLENTSGTTWLEVTLSDSIQLPRHYHFLCTEGYIDNTEGLQTYLNAPSNETFMQSNSTILIPEGESLEIPVNAQYNSFYTITTGGVEGSAVYFSNLDDNTTQIEYITIDSTDEVVKLYVDSVVAEEITIQETECSKYANNKLLFVNKYGAKQEFYVNMKSTEKIRVKDDGFSRNVIDYTNLSVTNGLHSYKRRVLESKEMHTLNTPFLDEENVQAFEELLLSEYVWYKKEGGDYIPVIIKDSNMTRKTHLNDKLIQYTIEVESANNLINIQR